MRFLLDENVSPLVATHLVEAGHDAVHVRSLGLQRDADPVIMDRALVEGRILVSGDTDFGQLLAASGASRPSIILLRRETDRRASPQAALVLANLEQIAGDLEAGAVVVVEPNRIRVRRLPLV